MATVTLKNIPDDLYGRLKKSAQAHHRSINSELISCLELVLAPRRVAPEDRLLRLRSKRPRFEPDAVSAEEIREAIERGRP